MPRLIPILSRVLILVLATACGAFPQNDPEWTEAFPPFHIAGNLYYVGSKGLASYLVVTPAGNILINSDLEANLPLIRASIEGLGFKFADTKILLISHAHFDHDAGSAKIKELTGASYMVMDADVPVVESGGKADFQYGNRAEFLYPPAKVDRALHDGDEVKLGGAVLVAHLTAGHTKGCTTWSMKVSEGGKTYNVVIVGSPNVNPGYKLVHNDAYPQIARDYQRTFDVLKALPCDIFLGAHGGYFGLEEKYAHRGESGRRPKAAPTPGGDTDGPTSGADKAGAANPFIDPAGYKKFVTEKEQEFRAELEKQTDAAK